MTGDQWFLSFAGVFLFSFLIRPECGVLTYPMIGSVAELREEDIAWN